MPDWTKAGARGPLAAARAVSIAEATSFLLLLVATAVKYGAHHPGGVRVLGPLHGALFVAYVVLVAIVGVTARWRRGRLALALLAAVLPVAPFFVERAWLRPAAAAPAAADGADERGLTKAG